MQMFLFYVLIAAAYALGSCSSAVIVCHFLKLPDPREHGSKNPGATNVLRLAGKMPALVVLVADALKGAIPVLLAKLFGIEGLAAALIGLAAVVGHAYPLFYKFKGGKGVATTMGAACALSWMLGVAAIFVWLGVAAATRFSSLASLSAVAALPAFNQFIASPHYFLGLILIAILVFYKHMDNIDRLLKGTERPISFSDSNSSPR